MRIRSLVEGAAVLAIGAFALDIGVDWLDAPEKTCRDELLKSSRMAGTTDFWIEKHYDFWTKTLSGGGWMMPWTSRPYETPKVWLIVDFTREQRPHHASIDCTFAKLPNTGEPPQIALQDVRLLSEDVLERTPRGELVWTPWPPRPLDANTASPRGH